MIPKPDLEDWQSWVEIFADGKPTPSLVAALTGVPKEVIVKAWAVGWPGHKKTGRGALPPIREVIEQMHIAAAAQRAALDERLNDEQRQAIDEAIRDGATRKALEGLVTQSFLRAIDKQIQNSIKLLQAADPLVELVTSQIRTMAESKKVTMAEARGALQFVTGYVRETGAMMDSYIKIEKTRTEGAPIKESEVSAEAKNPDKLIEELAGIIGGFRAIIQPKPKVIDVQSSPSSSSSSPQSS